MLDKMLWIYPSLHEVGQPFVPLLQFEKRSLYKIRGAFESALLRLSGCAPIWGRVVYKRLQEFFFFRKHSWTLSQKSRGCSWELYSCDKTRNRCFCSSTLLVEAEGRTVHLLVWATGHTGKVYISILSSWIFWWVTFLLTLNQHGVSIEHRDNRRRRKVFSPRVISVLKRFRRSW
jgi:hypothetical protein